MNCPKCNLDLRPILNFPGVRRVSFPHVCKQIPKLGPAFSSLLLQGWGAGPEWAPKAYGEYYAQSPAIYAAVKLRADSTAVAPLMVFRTTGDGESEPLEDTHPLAVLLAKVNPFYTNGDLLRATRTYLDLWGSAFWILKKASPIDPPTEIWMLRPDRMHILPDDDKYIAGFFYQTDMGKRIPLRRDEVVWLRNFNPLDEFAGFSPIAAARLSVDMGVEAVKHNRNIFKNGMLWGNIALATKDGATIMEDQVKELRDSLKLRYTGTNNSHVPLILQNMDAKNLGMTNKDMEFLASLRWSLEDVARVFKVPKPMIGDLENATYSNIDAAERIFWRTSMIPDLRFLEEQINEFLVPQFGDPMLFVRFVTDEIEALQADANEIAKRQQADVAVGIMTINEVREERGLDPVPWGDVAYMPIGVQSVETPEDARPQPLPALGDPNAAPAAPPPEKRLKALTDGTWKKYESPQLTDTFLGKVLDLHDRALTKGEHDFRRVQSGLFDTQRREILRRIAAQKEAGELTSKALPQFDFFNLRDWVQRFIRSGLPLYVTTSTLGATQQINAFSLGVAFDIRKIQAWLDKRVEFWATRVNEETARLLMDELSEGIGAGEAIKKLQARVERVFEFSDSVRSERIARTETQAAMNEGAVEAYRQSGVVERKMWLATLDNRTRDTHVEAHRQVVELEAHFFVGGEMIAHPGEGSPENAINCRCTVAPLISRRTWASPIAEMVKDEPKHTTTTRVTKRDSQGFPLETVTEETVNGHRSKETLP